MSGLRLSDHPSMGERFLAIDYKSSPTLAVVAPTPLLTSPPQSLVVRLYHFVRRKVLSYVRHLRHYFEDH